jgi:betaine-aldehyde dehydrogenase
MKETNMSAQNIQPLYIDGHQVDASSGETFTVTNPFDGSLLATIGQASQ